MNGGNPQTRASMKYQEKVGLVAKSYKIKKALADEFGFVGAVGNKSYHLRKVL